LDQQQCAEVNAVLDRLSTVPLEVGELRISRDRSEVDPAFNPSYLAD
jgi:hypothetical protein